MAGSRKRNVTTKLEELNLVDRFLFDETMENPEAYQAIVTYCLSGKLNCLTSRKLKKNKSVQNIANELEEDLEKVSRICETVSKYAPEYDCEKIHHEMHAKDNN